VGAERETAASVEEEASGASAEVEVAAPVSEPGPLKASLGAVSVGTPISLSELSIISNVVR
jgi:hypothetical protein